MQEKPYIESAEQLNKIVSSVDAASLRSNIAGIDPQDYLLKKAFETIIERRPELVAGISTQSLRQLRDERVPNHQITEEELYISSEWV